MKVFVSGGAGFVGSNLVDRLMAEGHTVCVYDNLSCGKKEYLSAHLKNRKFKLVKADLLDAKTLKKHLKGFDLVFHFASNPDIAKGMTHPDLDLYQGIMATFNILDAMRVNGVKKLMFTSGSGVYGDVGATYTAEDFGPLVPVSMYGASKLGAEGLISAFCYMFDMQAWTFRFANIIGPRQTHGVIHDFILRLAKEPRKLAILGDGRQSKSYLHVSDVLDAMFFCLKKCKARVNITNVATLNYATVRQIADIVCRGMNIKGVKYSYTGGTRGWKGDVPVVRIDTKKINKLGWKPKMTSLQAVERATADNIKLLCR